MGCRQGKEEKTEAAAKNAEQAAEGDKQEETVDSPRLIVVFGATGNQGGSVAAALLKDAKYKVRAITRNPDSQKAKDLSEKGAEVVKADFDDEASLKSALEGAYGAYLVTDFWALMDMEKEIRQGKAAVDAAKAAGIEHLVFSSLENVKEALGKSCKHYDSKAAIEEYIKEVEVPYTAVLFSFYADNLFTQSKPQKNEDGEFVLNIPMGDVAMDYIPAREAGECVRSILDSPDEYKGKQIGLSADSLKIEEYAAIMTKVCEDKKFVAGKITPEELGAMEFPGAEDLAVMFEFGQSGGQVRDVALTRKLYPEIPTFEQWAERNKEAIQALE